MEMIEMMKNKNDNKNKNKNNNNNNNIYTTNDKLIFMNFIEKNNKIKNIKIYVIKLINNTKLYKYKILNKSLSICAHILIMVIFEIYFFFGFIVDIENKKFIGKIESYFTHLEPIEINNVESQVIKQLISRDYQKNIIENLHENYIISKEEQKHILNVLFIRSCKMAGSLGVIFFILILISLYNRKHIEWTTIIIENIIMFCFLGIFEYYFFINVIMKYEPVTNEEIQYKITDGFFYYINELNKQ